MNALPAWYWAVFGALVAASVASFLGVVVERVPRGERLGGRSHCACGRQLTAAENIPVIGWLRCRGRTVCCGAALPRWYVVSEAGSLLVGAGAGLVAGINGIALAGSLQVLVAGVVVVRRRRTTARGVTVRDGDRS